MNNFYGISKKKSVTLGTVNVTRIFSIITVSAPRMMSQTESGGSIMPDLSIFGMLLCRA
jgi:hypothetical protein